MYTKLARAVVVGSALSGILLALTPANAHIGIAGRSNDATPTHKGLPPAERSFDAAGTVVSKATMHTGIENVREMIWPVRDTINTPFTGEHSGIDIEGETGDPIIAAASGKITFAGDDGDGYGIKIVIRHDRTISTLYSHLQDMEVTKGFVDRGDVIGTVGCTGSCSGDHLHFEVLEKGTPTNPVPFLEN